MRAFCLLAIITMNLALSSASFAEGNNVVIIDRGPVVFSSSETKSSLKVQIDAERFEGCRSVYFFIMARSLDDGKDFCCMESVNGVKIGGSGSRDETWSTGGVGREPSILHAGENEIELEATAISSNPTYQGEVGGLAIYFSYTDGEEVGPINYPPGSGPRYGFEEPQPSPKVNFWAEGSVHDHTLSSDGSKSVKERCLDFVNLGKKLGFDYDFVVFTDHFEELEQPIKSPGRYYKWVTQPLTPVVGLDNYIKSCHEVTHDGQFVAIAGAEINTPWQPDSGKTASAHTLYIGEIKKTAALDAAQNVEGKQPEVISAIKESGGISDAAHATLDSFNSVSIRPWEGLCFQYDRRGPERYMGLYAVEWFNTLTIAQDEAIRNWFMTFMKQHKPVFPTGGSDSHGWTDKEDLTRLKRLTCVYVKELTTSSILEGMKAGHVYASREAVRATYIIPVPGFEPLEVERAEFECLFEGLPQKLQCMVYRDGEPVKESKKTVSPESPIYYWQDVGAKGHHWYNLMLEPFYLITAPIVLKISN